MKHYMAIWADRDQILFRINGVASANFTEWTDVMNHE